MKAASGTRIVRRLKTPSTIFGRRRRRFAAGAAALSLLLTVGGESAASAAPLPASAPPFLMPTNSGWNLVTFNAYNPDFYSPKIDDLAVLPLAVQNLPKQFSYIPELATSWTIQGHTVRIQLRHDAKWQNGKPVTSADVVTTVLLNGTVGDAPWPDVVGVKAAGPDTVVFQVSPATPALIAERDILTNVFPVPSSQYGRYLPSDAGTLEAHYYSSDVAATTEHKAAPPMTGALKALAQKLPKLAISRVIGDGPYRVAGMSHQELKLVKSPTFWAAKSIHPTVVESEAFGSATGEYPLFVESRADFSGTGMGYNIYEHILRSEPTNHFSVGANISQQSLLFNDRRYPLNNVKVRQAIAYLFNRKRILNLQDGGKTHNHWIRHPDGLVNTIETTYLSRKQIDSLNPYSYNPAKAAALLESAGFKKVKGTWITPKGTPFTLSLGIPAGWAGQELFGPALASVLSTFGIKTTASAVEQPAFWTYGTDGNFDLDWGWSVNENLDPLGEFANPLVSQNFLVASAGSSSEPGIGFGPTADVPGLGDVNISTTLASEHSTVTSPAQLDKLTWDWARLVNEQLPYLPYADGSTAEYYSTAHYTDWPPASSQVWSLLHFIRGSGLLVLFEDGYVRPK